MTKTEEKLLDLCKRMLDDLSEQCYGYAVEIRELEAECVSETEEPVKEEKPTGPPPGKKIEAEKLHKPSRIPEFGNDQPF